MNTQHTHASSTSKGRRVSKFTHLQKQRLLNAAGSFLVATIAIIADQMVLHTGYLTLIAVTAGYGNFILSTWEYIHSKNTKVKTS